MSAEEVYHSITQYLEHHLEHLFGGVTGALTGVALFQNHSLQPLADYFNWSMVAVYCIKIGGVILFSTIGAATGFYVKRFLEKWHGK